mgnify:CR=1 FL=1
MIIGLCAGGMTAREIRHHSGVHHRRGPEQGDDLEGHRRGAPVPSWSGSAGLRVAFYPVIRLDAIRADGPRRPPGAGDARTRIAVGAGHGRRQARGLRIWIQDGEGASFWAHVCADLANRGVQDVLIVCCDGLTGLPEAVEATWPDSMVQTCVVHLIRASMRFVAYGDRKGVAAALRPIYTAPDEEAARRALDAFRQSDPGRKYPQTAATWERAWERFIPFLAFPPALRRVTSAPPTRSSR